MLMRYGDYKNMIRFDRIEQLIGKGVKQTFPDVAPLNRPSLRINRNPQGRFFNPFLKFPTKALIFKLVITNSIVQFLPGVFRENDLQRSSLKTSSMGTPSSPPAR